MIGQKLFGKWPRNLGIALKQLELITLPKMAGENVHTEHMVIWFNAYCIAVPSELNSGVTRSYTLVISLIAQTIWR